MGCKKNIQEICRKKNQKKDDLRKDDVKLSQAEMLIEGRYIFIVICLKEDGVIMLFLQHLAIWKKRVLLNYMRTEDIKGDINEIGRG